MKYADLNDKYMIMLLFYRKTYNNLMNTLNIVCKYDKKTLM